MKFVKLLVFVLVLFFSTYGYSQVVQWVDTDKKIVQVSADKPLPVSGDWSQNKFDSLVVLFNSLKDFIITKDYETVPDTNGMFRCTVDSVTIPTCTNWFTVEGATKDSTMWICFTRNLTYNKLIPIYAGGYNAKMFDVNVGTKMYFLRQTPYSTFIFKVN